MQPILITHIAAGTVALLAGYVALYSTKGKSLHRKSGMLFVYAMLAMCLGGFVIAAIWNRAAAINVQASLLTAYLVVTGLTAVKPLQRGARRLHIGGMLVAAGVAITDSVLAAQAIANGGKRHGIPAFPFILFAVVSVLAFSGDFRLLRARLQGARRIARHLWRITFALWIATMSFFIGQAKVIPKSMRVMPLLAVPVVAVLVTMFYWMWRVRGRRALRGTFLNAAPAAAES